MYSYVSSFHNWLVGVERELSSALGFGRQLMKYVATARCDVHQWEHNLSGYLKAYDMSSMTVTAPIASRPLGWWSDAGLDAPPNAVQIDVVLWLLQMRRYWQTMLAAYSEYRQHVEAFLVHQYRLLFLQGLLQPQRKSEVEELKPLLQPLVPATMQVRVFLFTPAYM
jgi:hypothetical protein